MNRITTAVNSEPYDEDMFSSAWKIRKKPFYQFEIKSRSRRHNKYTLFVMQNFAYIRQLRQMVEETSIAAVSISSNESSENEVIADMTFKEAGCQ